MSGLGCVYLYMTNKPYEPQKRTSQAHAFFGSKQSIYLMRDFFSGCEYDDAWEGCFDNLGYIPNHQQL